MILEIYYIARITPPPARITPPPARITPFYKFLYKTYAKG